MSKIIVDNLSKKNINRADFIKNGFSAQKYDDVVRGKSNFKLNEIVEMSEKFQLSLDYLITGKENCSSTDLSADEHELLTYYKLLDTAYKNRVISKAETLAEVIFEKQGKPPEPIIQICATTSTEVDPEEGEKEIPFYDLPVSAGTGVYLSSCDASPLRVRCTVLTDDADYALRISGDSMEPFFSDGDIVVIRHTPTLQLGDTGIFIINGEGYIKKFGGNRLISLNDDYEDIPFKENDDIRCQGRVLGVLPDEDILD